MKIKDEQLLFMSVLSKLFGDEVEWNMGFTSFKRIEDGVSHYHVMCTWGKDRCVMSREFDSLEEIIALLGDSHVWK